MEKTMRDKMNDEGRLVETMFNVGSTLGDIFDFYKHASVVSTPEMHGKFIEGLLQYLCTRHGITLSVIETAVTNLRALGFK